AFLADLRVGIMAIPESGRGPLTVPVWYGYTPGGDVWLATGRNSRKGKLLLDGLRVSLTVQTEDAPYKYVSVEGPISSLSVATGKHEWPLAHRYLGQKMGDGYMAANGGGDNILVSIKPERWLTSDYSKVSLGAE
ncbi:MAG: pyridoxamine 5'-phosphate oxidase family protein, partial [Proteobacteria bacterium]|nr:pyridoxamine 5'-phosphate oxidase family protein [Pseudomonadota bacterium]